MALDGINFEKTHTKWSRNNSYRHEVPIIDNKIKAKKNFLSMEWKINSLFTKKDIKITIPGPLTIMDTTYNEYYENEMLVMNDLVKVINLEIKDLEKNGCKHIQIDEPVFARYPNRTIEYGVKLLDKCFENIGDNVHKSVHICCGYPDKLNKTDYPKANKLSYFKIASILDNSVIDSVSIEDAHCHNDLSLLSLFKNKIVILGVICISYTRIETVNEIEDRIREALKYIEPSRLMISPDCGLAMLSREIVIQKLKNMVQAVQNINNSLIK